MSFCHLPIRAKTEKSPGQAALETLESPLSFQVVVFGWLAGGYVDTQRNGSLMEKEGGREECLAKEKKERKDQRERGRANLHTLGAVKMSVGEIE